MEYISLMAFVSTGSIIRTKLKLQVLIALKIECFRLLIVEILLSVKPLHAFERDC